MKKTGEILKTAREKSGLSLHEIGLHIKINNKILKAIEDGDFKKLPAKTFLRGFVRSYATFLKINVDEVMQVFHEEMGTTKPAMPSAAPSVQAPTQQPAATGNQAESVVMPTSETKEASVTIPEQKLTNQTQEEKHQLNDTPIPQGDLVDKIEKKRNALAMTVAGIGVGLVLVVVGINKIVEKYTKEIEPNQVSIQEPIDQSELNQQAAEATTENTSPEQAAIVQNNTTTSSNVVPPPSPPLSTPEATTSTVTTPAVVSPNQQTTSMTTVPNASPTPSPVQAVATPKPESSAPIEKKIETDRNKPVELIVEAASDVEIQYSTQSGKIEVVKLKADQVHTFKSKQGLKVRISDAGAVNLILNGRDIGSPGNKGKQVKLSY